MEGRLRAMTLERKPVRAGLRAATIALALATILAGCAGSAPTQSPTDPPSPTLARTAAIPAEARLTVTASGTVACSPPFGCRPSFTIAPGHWGPDPSWMPTPDDPEFPLVFAPTANDGSIHVGHDATGVPTTIAPGGYRVATAVAMVSDMASPPFGLPILGASYECFENLVVTPSTTEVAIHVTFGYGPCMIEIKLR